MCRIIAIANQKGGVGKTTTCEFGELDWQRAEKKVLLVEADAQEYGSEFGYTGTG